MSAIEIVFLDRATLPSGTVLRTPVVPHTFVSYDSTNDGDVARRIAGATVVVTNKVPIDRESMLAAAKLKCIAVAATGTDTVDITAARDLRITVSNVRNYAIHTVPEHTFAMILALRRSIIAYRQSVASGRWQEAGQFCYFDFPVRELANSTLGVIGSGALGRAVGTLGRAFGMRVLMSERRGASTTRPGLTPFKEVLRESDVLTLHVPLNASTCNLISSNEFAQMNQKPLLINTARGGLVNEAALVKAVRSGQIAGAAFDVATNEPPPLDHPLMTLLGHANFLLTPHVAWASKEATQSLADQLIDNIDAFFAGSPRNVM